MFFLNPISYTLWGLITSQLGNFNDEYITGARRGHAGLSFGLIAGDCTCPCIDTRC